MKYNFLKTNKYRSISKEKSLIKETRVIGQCYYHLHKGYLTYTTLKGHRCLEKKCPYFAQKPDVNIEDINEQSKNEKRNQTYIDLLHKLRKYKMISEKQYKEMKNASKKQKCEIITKYTTKLRVRKVYMKPINIFVAKCKRVKALIKRFFAEEDIYTKISKQQGCSRKKAKQILRSMTFEKEIEKEV